MILLTSTSDKIQLVTSGTADTDVHASWLDNLSGAITPGRTNTATITSATTTDVIAAPASSTQRNVKFLSIRNKHASSSQTITVKHTDGTNALELIKLTLNAGWELIYNDGSGWELHDASGGIVTAAISGLFLVTTVKTSGTTHTTGPLTNNIFIRLVGAGGGGGNATGNATQAAVATGGGGGGYAEKWFAVSPNTAYTCALGTAGAAGTNGGNTTFTVGATTVTAFGGSAGVGGVTQTNTTSFHFPGGAGGVVSTNGDVNGGGMPGYPAMRAPGTAAIATNSFYSGGGGSSAYGGGGTGSGTAGNGAAGTGFGSGGAGGLSNTAGANNGGSGTGGLIIIDEYT